MLEAQDGTNGSKGDLGVEIVEDVTLLQKMMIKM